MRRFCKNGLWTRFSWCDWGWQSLHLTLTFSYSISGWCSVRSISRWYILWLWWSYHTPSWWSRVFITTFLNIGTICWYGSLSCTGQIIGGCWVITVFGVRFLVHGGFVIMWFIVVFVLMLKVFLRLRVRVQLIISRVVISFIMLIR